PNPLANSGRMSFTLPRAAHVELTITDALGRTVDHVDAGQLAAGTQSVTWNRKSLRAGVYFFRLSFDGQAAGTRQGVLTE
ncbi:MAG: T9SS type A sorting domain-containing protein, partial [Hymenobacter sp.]